LIPDAVVSIKIVTCDEVKEIMVDGIQTFKTSGFWNLVNGVTIVKSGQEY
jgi:hypothetical protein